MTKDSPTFYARLRYLLVNAPLAMLSSSLPGFSLYVCTVYLNYVGDPAAAGNLRVYVSYFSIAAIPFLNESAKFFIRHAVTGNAVEIAKILYFRLLLAAAGGSLCVAGIATARIYEARALFDLATVGLISALYYPFDMFASVLQARQDFWRLTVMNAVKHAVSTVALLAGVLFGVPILLCFAAYAAINAAFGLVFTVQVGRAYFAQLRLFSIRELRESDIKNAFTLTVANAIPYSLEHIDKFIVFTTFSAEVLGIYALGFSTGRFAYNTLKPVTFIYYHWFVRNHVKTTMLLYVFLLGSAVGGLCTLALHLVVTHVGGMAFFRDAAPMACAIFAAYGIAFINIVELQSKALHVTARISLVFYANLVSGIACLIAFAVAPFLALDIALLVLAAHFAIRHFVSFIVLRFGAREGAARGLGAAGMNRLR